MRNNTISLKVNMLLNLLRTVFMTVFPLISFKYISSVLGKNGIGIINFSNSIIQYFSIIAALGISTYATRECAKVRDDNKKLNKVSSELFSINIISTLVSYALLVIVLFAIPKLYSYRGVVIILSINILCTTIGAEWINIVQEDYLYITVRTVVIQIVSLVLTVLFVKNPNDYIKYAMISVMTSFCISLLNWFYIRRYVTLRIVINKSLFKHLKPVFIIFFMNIAITIYVTADITILGLLKGEAEVGLYTVATKIYSCLKSILVAIVSVTIPRLSYIIEKNKKEYLEQLRDIISILLLLCIPIVVAVQLLPEFLIRTISNEEYYGCRVALQLLGIAVLPTMLSTIINNNILLAQRKESHILMSTCIGSITNIGLNFVLIPQFGIDAAAFTTLIAEVLVCVIAIIQGKATLKGLNLVVLISDLIKVIIGTLLISILYILVFAIFDRTYVILLLFILFSGIMYFVVELFLGHSGLLFFVNMKKTNMKSKV